MARLLSLILIGVLALGNSFSHSHGHCHSGPRTGVAHIHLSYANGFHGAGHCRHSHSHPHKHVKGGESETSAHHDVKAEYESEVPETARLSAVKVDETEQRSSCLALDCTCSEQVVSVPLLVAIVENSDQGVNGNLSISILREPFLVSIQTRAVSDYRASRCSPRYSTPIFLRHSALLI